MVASYNEWLGPYTSCIINTVMWRTKLNEILRLPNKLISYSLSLLSPPSPIHPVPGRYKTYHVHHIWHEQCIFSGPQ